MSEKAISPLRQRMIEDMSVRNFVEKTRNDYIRHVKTFTAFLGRSPETATPEDLRRFQLHQTQTGVRPPTINGAVVALRFFFTVTVGQANMARHLTFVREPRKIPAVLSEEEIARLLGSAAGLYSIAYRITRDHLDRVHYDDRYSGMGLFGLGPARSGRSASDGHAALLVNDQRQAAIELAI